MSRFFRVWRQSVRSLFDLPYITHCELLTVIADSLYIEIHNCYVDCPNVYLSLCLVITITHCCWWILANSFHLLIAKSLISYGMFKRRNLSQLLKHISGGNAPSEVNLQIFVFNREYPTCLSVDNFNDLFKFNLYWITFLVSALLYYCYGYKYILPSYLMPWYDAMKTRTYTYQQC
jgi:hypothetical protein